MKKFKVSAFDAEVYQALSDPVVFADLFNGSVFQGDWIAPVFTVVFYYGEEQDWDGPVRIHEMLDFPEEIEPWIPCIPDYKINLVSSRTVDKENFQTGLREVFELLGVMGDREKLERQKGKRKLHLNSWKVWAPFPRNCAAEYWRRETQRCWVVGCGRRQG